MRRNEHVGARVLAVTGLVGGAAYLVWRLAASMSGSPWWLAVPFYLVELCGFVATSLLVWALWPVPTARLVERAPVAGRSVDAVVRVHLQSAQDLRATLLALGHVDGIGGVVVVDHDGRSEVAAMTTEFQAVYAATDPGDCNGLGVVIAAVRSAEFLLLDAGDVPTTDIVGRLGLDLVDPRVAVVQGLGVSLADDSPEHGPDRRHELVFERSALNPALGRRGVAVWLGSGSLVRTAALRDVPISERSSVEALWTATSALHAAGWRVTAPAEVPVVAHRDLRDADAVYDERVERVRAARAMAFGDLGAFQGRSLGLTQRLAALAWCVRPLSGARRVAFVSLLCAAMLSGEVPFSGSVAAMAVLWLPYFTYSSLAVCLLSGWTLRPGDRTRWSLHNIGATMRSTMDPAGAPDRQPIVNLPASQYGSSLVVVVVALSVVLVLRGLSDRFTHTMGELPQPALLAMVAASLWLLGLSLDLLRVLGRKAHVRRATRVGAALAASFGDRAVSLLDLTALGAGVVSHAGFAVGERAVLETSVPTRTGVTSVTVTAVVRNVSLLPLGEWRLGLEFESIDDASANAFAEYCMIEPVWEQLGVMPGTSITDSRPVMSRAAAEPAASAGRMVLRVIALLALVGAVASSLPAQAEASALAPRWTGTVVLDSTGRGVAGVQVTAVCHRAPEGTTTSVVTDEQGHFEVDLAGQQCRGWVAPPKGMAVVDSASASRVGLVRSTNAVDESSFGVLVAQVLSVGGASDQHLRTTLSLVVMMLIAVIAGSLLVGLHRPKRYAVA
ncbi:MAG: hypothetical protein RJA49_2568 [Actinomycetota bacterium]